MQEKDKVTIKIPRVLYQKLKGRIKDTGFSSVNQFIVHCMRDIASEGSLKQVQDSGLSQKEVEILRQRLRNLGYID